ncbi:hypothetical protein [Halodurantibacterium flavum]|uniref:Uncharacterized protein n=1 Tax=Halodurantibacterium flavum TaxID=1382802 RepID=A0ABW4S8C3_9RHOB
MKRIITSAAASAMILAGASSAYAGGMAPVVVEPAPVAPAPAPVAARGTLGTGAIVGALLGLAVIAVAVAD